MRRPVSLLVVLFATLAHCGGGAPPAPPSVNEGEPSGIAECDSFAQAACECAAKLPAAKSACDLAKKSSTGWRAAADIPAQKEAAARACTRARDTLTGYDCAKAP
jgi:hypothetical protein